MGNESETVIQLATTRNGTNMTSSTTSIFFLLCVCLLIRDFSDCCTDSELVRVCRIATSQLSATFQCLCGVGCHKEFPFKTRLECETSLKEGNGHVLNAKLDPCLSNPCLNRGELFSSDLGDTNANALEQITMETAVKKNVRQDWVPTLLECPKNHQIFHLIV